MGGYSSEYKISLTSGNVVFNNINREKYNPYRIHIFKEKWVYVDENDAEFPIDKNDFSITINGTKINFDVVFNAIHFHFLTLKKDNIFKKYFLQNLSKALNV